MGQKFSEKIPDGDDKLRQVCDTCGFINYVNPKIVAGSVATKDDRILLCRRAIAMEEAHAVIQIDQILGVYSVPRISQVQIMFRARLMSDISAGPESLEVDLFKWKDIPWRELAFPTVVWALTHFASVRGQSSFVPFLNPPGTERITT